MLIDPAQLPALYDQPPIVKDAAYWQDKYECLVLTLRGLARSLDTPMGKMIVLDRILRECKTC